MGDTTGPHRDQLDERLAAIAKRYSGQLALAARHLETGEEVALQANEVLPTASVIKVPILVELMRQVHERKVSLSSRVDVSAAEQVGGSGILKVFDGGLAPTVRDLATLMVVVSDNTATNKVLDLVGGVEPVNSAMRALGLGSIVLHNRVDFEAIDGDVRRLGESSPADMCRLIELIARGEVVSRDASEAMMDILGKQQYLDQVPRYFEYDPYWRELGEQPTLDVGCKTGFFTGTRVDAGAVTFRGGGGFAYAVFNDAGGDLTFLPEAEGSVTNGLVGKALLDYWWPRDRGEAPLRASAYDLA